MGELTNGAHVVATVRGQMRYTAAGHALVITTAAGESVWLPVSPQGSLDDGIQVTPAAT